jgi:hypothetical protein
MTREKAIEELEEWMKHPNRKQAREAANDILCDLLRSLGYADVVFAWSMIQ